MTTYKCPKCESTNLIARLDGRLRINNQKFYPAEHTAVADVTAWRHVDCLDCDESFEGHELTRESANPLKDTLNALKEAHEFLDDLCLDGTVSCIYVRQTEKRDAIYGAIRQAIATLQKGQDQ